MNASPDRLTFTADELADALHLAPSTVRLWCQRGEIAATKRGRLWRIPRREYLRLVGDDAGRSGARGARWRRRTAGAGAGAAGHQGDGG
jgi:excisionase family DNA binding protein